MRLTDERRAIQLRGRRKRRHIRPVEILGEIGCTREAASQLMPDLREGDEQVPRRPGVRRRRPGERERDFAIGRPDAEVDSGNPRIAAGAQLSERLLHEGVGRLVVLRRDREPDDTVEGALTRLERPYESGTVGGREETACRGRDRADAGPDRSGGQQVHRARPAGVRLDAHGGVWHLRPPRSGPCTSAIHLHTQVRGDRAGRDVQEPRRTVRVPETLRHRALAGGGIQVDPDDPVVLIGGLIGDTRQHRESARLRVRLTHENQRDRRVPGTLPVIREKRGGGGLMHRLVREVRRPHESEVDIPRS